MKPKTKIQIRVDKLSRKLPKLTAAQKKWAGVSLFKHYVYKTKKKNTCLECGHSWDEKHRIPLDKLLKETCPKCGTVLESILNKKRTDKTYAIFYIAIIIDEFQVLMYYNISRKCKVGISKSFSITEICQHWISSKGKHTVRSICANPYLNFVEHAYSLGSPMEIRRNKENYYMYGTCCPGAKYLKVLRRNGFRGKYHKLHPAFFFQVILSNPCAETLLKARQYSLLNKLGDYYDRFRIKRYWPSIKICLRNSYIVKDASMWMDHMELLEYFQKDMSNAHYVCPENLTKEHDILIRRKQRLETIKKQELQKKQIAEDNISFKKEKARYFGIKLSNGTINVVVLDDVSEYLVEGENLHHCLFSNGYHKRKDTLILSARENGKRIATVEFSLKDMKVLQCRGNYNSTPDKRNEILSLIEENISLFKKARNAPKKPTSNIIRMYQNVEERIAI